MSEIRDNIYFVDMNREYGPVADTGEVQTRRAIISRDSLFS